MNDDDGLTVALGDRPNGTASTPTTVIAVRFFCGCAEPSPLQRRLDRRFGVGGQPLVSPRLDLLEHGAE